MANLSNINGKFVVEQTTGYVGIGTTNPNFLIEAAGTNAELALNASSIYRVRSTSNDEFIITKNGVGDRLTIAGGGNATFSGDVHLTDEKILAFRSTNDYAIQYRDLDFRFIGSADGTTNRKFSFGYYTSDNPAGTWNGKVYINSYTGDVGIGTSSPSTLISNSSLRNAAASGLSTSLKGLNIEVPAGPNSQGYVASFANSQTASSNYNAGVLIEVGSTDTTTRLLSVESGGLTRFEVRGDGHVGIGTNTPENALHIQTSTTNTSSQLMVQNGSSGDAAIKFNISGQSYVIGIDNSDSDKFKIAGSSDLGISDRLTIDSSGNATFAESVVIGTSINTGIPFVVQETTASGFAIGFMRNTNSTDGNGLVIDVNSTGGSYIQDWRQGGSVKMRLLQNGNLGIGVTSADAVLDIYSPYDVTANPNSTGIRLRRVAGGSQSYLLGMGVSGISNDYFAIRDITNSAYRFVLTDSGNIGIGNTNPSTKLEIQVSTNQNILRGHFGQSADIFLGFDQTNPRLLLQDNSNVTTHLFQANTANYIVGSNVGINTTSPIAQLDVAGNTNQHHSASTVNNGGWRNIQNLGVTGWLDQTYSAGRIKVFGYENSNVNVSYCEYYVIRSSAGYHIQQIGTRLDQGNTNGHVEVQISGNFLQVRNVAQSSLGAVRIVFSGMKD